LFPILPPSCPSSVPQNIPPPLIFNYGHFFLNPFVWSKRPTFLRFCLSESHHEVFFPLFSCFERLVYFTTLPLLPYGEHQLAFLNTRSLVVRGNLFYKSTIEPEAPTERAAFWVDPCATLVFNITFVSCSPHEKPVP